MAKHISFIGYGFTTILFLILGFLLFINITPGHFQRGCAYCTTTITYSQQFLCKPCITTCIAPDYSPFQRFLLWINTYDAMP